MKLTRNGGIAILATFALAACNDAVSPDELNTAIDDDVALVAADAAIEDVQQMIFGIGQGAPGMAAAAAAVPRNFTRTVTFLDAAGLPQDAFNALTTASIEIHVEMDGAVERDGWTATVSRVRDMVVSGLEGEETERTWNGTGTGTTTRSQHTDTAGETRSYGMVSEALIENVVVGLPRAENPWPLSGTITRTVTITITNGPNGDEVRTRTVVLTFNGTQFVTLIVGDQTYEVDLGARETDRPHRKRD